VALTTQLPVIKVLTGCTASGKTEWALRYAQTTGAEIISADSLLFYRGLDIGTAKPTKQELNLIKHHLIDVMDLNESMNIAHYVTLAQQIVKEIHFKKKTVLVVGGSGFYLKAFFKAVADQVEVSPQLRKTVDDRLIHDGLSSLVTELESLNPQGLGALDIDNPRRVTRALERCLSTGMTLAQLASEFEKIPSPFMDYTIELTRIEQSPTELLRRIELRVSLMLQAGLVDEVKHLLTLGLRNNLSASRAIGYREVIAYLDGKISLSALAPEIIANTKALVKKQQTWFRTQLPAHQVLPTDSLTTPAALFTR
jgi:tRNA dimethylallyltransferase